MITFSGFSLCRYFHVDCRHFAISFCRTLISPRQLLLIAADSCHDADATAAIDDDAILL